MLSGEVLGDARAVYSHCMDTLQKTENEPKTGDQKSISIRQFVFVQSEEINRDEIDKLNTVKGTRKMHSVKSTSEKGVIKTRNLSSYCNRCIVGEPCENAEHVED